MSPLLLLLAQASDPVTMLAVAHDAVAGPRCVYDAASTDVTVCGLRHADKYRVPFVVHDPGDPRYEAVSDERQRLLHKTTPLQDLSPFLVGGGEMGISVSTDGHGPARVAGLRQLAP